MKPLMLLVVDEYHFLNVTQHYTSLIYKHKTNVYKLFRLWSNKNNNK